MLHLNSVSRSTGLALVLTASGSSAAMASDVPPEEVVLLEEAEPAPVGNESLAVDAPQPDSLDASNVNAWNWIGVAYQQDFLVLRSSRAACSGGSSYDCYYGDGAYYDTEPFAPDDSRIGFAGNQVSSGFASATGRVLLTYDRRIGSTLTLGTAVGWAFGYAPVRPDLLPLHIEVRGNYFPASLGKDSMSPFLGLSTGMAEVAASQKLIVYEPSTRDPNTGETPETELEAWTNPGRLFVGLGLGARMPVGAELSLSLEGRAMVLFPEYGFNTGLKAGLTRAF